MTASSHGVITYTSAQRSWRVCPQEPVLWFAPAPKSRENFREKIHGGKPRQGGKSLSPQDMSSPRRQIKVFIGPKKGRPGGKPMGGAKVPGLGQKSASKMEINSLEVRAKAYRRLPAFLSSGLFVLRTSVKLQYRGRNKKRNPELVVLFRRKTKNKLQFCLMLSCRKRLLWPAEKNHSSCFRHQEVLIRKIQNKIIDEHHHLRKVLTI